MATRVAKFDKKQLKAKVEEGWIHINVLYEIVGNPKDHVQKAMELFLDNISKDPHILTTKEEIDDTIELENGIFSVAGEVEYLVFGLDKLTWLAFNFMPASIEVKAPAQLTFKDKDFSGWMNDLLAKLHEVNAVHTALVGEKDGLVRNLNAAIKNSILLALHEPRLEADLAKKVGLSKEQLALFLDAMVQEKKIAKDGAKYKRV
jgi:hypothetical protein